MQNWKNFSIKKLLVLILVAGFCTHSAVCKEAGIRAYRPPQILSFKKDVVYGVNEAEIYVGIEPAFELQNPVLLRLETSHDTLLLQSESGMSRTTTLALFLEKGKTEKLHFRLKKRGKFSMASLGLTLVSYYPQKQVIKSVKGDYKTYPDNHRREDLVEWLKQREESFEKRYGVFLYGNKFVKE